MCHLACATVAWLITHVLFKTGGGGSSEHEDIGWVLIPLLSVPLACPVQNPTIVCYWTSWGQRT